MPVLPLTRADAPRQPVPSPIRFAPERIEDAAAVDAVIDRAFGPGRFAKTAERLREGGRLRHDLSICAWVDGVLTGAVRLWPVRIGTQTTLFLGPIAVEHTARGHGLGAELVEQACARAKAAGERAVILVGDTSFFAPLGFEPAPAGRVTPPGPVDPGRLLWTALTPGGLDGLAGPLTRAPSA